MLILYWMHNLLSIRRVKSIVTELYRFISMHSKLEDMAQEAAWQRMKMVSKMEEEEGMRK